MMMKSNSDGKTANSYDDYSKDDAFEKSDNTATNQAVPVTANSMIED